MDVNTHDTHETHRTRDTDRGADASAPRARRRSVVLAAVLGAMGMLGASCSGDDGDGPGAASDFCTEMRSFEALQAEGDALFERSTEASADELRAVFSRVSAAIDAVVASAPEEVSTDARLVGETTQQLIDAYERADYDLVALATDPQYAEVLVSLDDARVTEANDRLAVYVRDRCDAPATTEPA